MTSWTNKFNWADNGESISRNAASSNLIVHDVINLYYTLLFTVNIDVNGQF